MVERPPHGKQARLNFPALLAPKQEHLWLPEELLLQQAQLLFKHKRQLDIPSCQNQALTRQQASLGAEFKRLAATVTQPMIDVYGGLVLARRLMPPWSLNPAGWPRPSWPPWIPVIGRSRSAAGVTVGRPA